MTTKQTKEPAAAEAELKAPATDAAALVKVDPETGEVLDESALYDAYAEDAGAGFENQTQEDVGIPYTVLMQPLSPEVQAEDSPVKPGAWVNRGTSEVFADGALFVPCYTRHVYREWSSKDPSGAAPIADHEIDSPLIVSARATQPFGDYVHPDFPEHPLSEVFDVFGISVNAEGTGIPSVVTFGSTAIRSYKDWMLRARSIVIAAPGGRKITNVPLFAHVYKLGSKRVEKKPHVWYVPDVSFANAEGAAASRLRPDDHLYRMAKQLLAAVRDGKVKAAAPSRAEGGDAPRGASSTETEAAPY